MGPTQSRADSQDAKGNSASDGHLEGMLQPQDFMSVTRKKNLLYFKVSLFVKMSKSSNPVTRQVFTAFPLGDGEGQGGAAFPHGGSVPHLCACLFPIQKGKLATPPIFTGEKQKASVEKRKLRGHSKR